MDESHKIIFITYAYNTSILADTHALLVYKIYKNKTKLSGSMAMQLSIKSFGACMVLLSINQFPTKWYYVKLCY